VEQNALKTETSKAKKYLTTEENEVIEKRKFNICSSVQRSLFFLCGDKILSVLTQNYAALGS
jgi:hypothetical protein